MSLGYDKPLYCLAFDHRTSFERLLASEMGSVPERGALICRLKHLIWQGFLRAVEDGAPADAASILIDDRYAVEIARAARERKYLFALAVEKSGQEEFDFEHADDFGKAIDELDPTFAKVLVRYNPLGDPALNRRQRERLRRLSDWLHERDRKLMLELLVPAEPAQDSLPGAGSGRSDIGLRPSLMLEAIAEIQDAEIEPDLWKIEGLERREDCRWIAERVREDGRERVSCVVLGRGESTQRVEDWLRSAAGVDGYTGFAIGRSIFWPPLRRHLAGENDLPATVELIAENFRHFIDVWTATQARLRTQ